MNPPIIFAQRCKRIIGCKLCVEAWYGGPGQLHTFPKWRSERAYAETYRLLGVDDFLQAIKATNTELLPLPGSSEQYHSCNAEGTL